MFVCTHTCSDFLCQHISSILCPSRCRNTCRGAACQKSDLAFHRVSFHLYTSVSLRPVGHSFFSSPERHEKLIYDPAVRSVRLCSRFPPTIEHWESAEHAERRNAIVLRSSFLIESSVLLSSTIFALWFRNLNAGLNQHSFFILGRITELVSQWWRASSVLV